MVPSVGLSPLKALVVQHLPWEGLGIIGSCLVERGIPRKVVRLFKDDAIPFDDLKAGKYRIVIGLGSSSTAYKPKTNLHHQDELKMFRLARHLGVPSFDICYSMQLFCVANGGSVAPNPNGKEVGFSDCYLTPYGRDDPVTGPLEDFRMLQWHGDHVTKMPEGASHLAYSKVTKYQIAVVDRIHYLIQGDGQASRPRMLSSWFRNDGKWARQGTNTNPTDIMTEAHERKVYYETSYRQLFGSFLNLVTRKNE